MVTNSAIILIMFGNFFYAFNAYFKLEVIYKNMDLVRRAIMTRLVGTFAAGFGVLYWYATIRWMVVHLWFIQHIALWFVIGQ